MEEQNEMSIAKVMEKGLHLQVTQKPEPLQSGDLKTLQLLTTGKKIYDESVENLNDMFRFCFMLIGLREKNLPNELETLFLHQYVRENYGGHSIEEIRNAFTMAVKNELDIDQDEVTSYENFSPRYFSNIVNAYRRWASQEFRRLEQHIHPTESEMKLLDAPKPEISWGYLIERQYQHFLSFGPEHWKLYPVSFYDQLVKDDLVDRQLFRKAMPVIRKKIIGELQKERAVLEMRKFSDDNPSEVVLKVKSITQRKISELDKSIESNKSGEGDEEMEIMAKQYCVLQFFIKSKKDGLQNVYKPEK